MAGSLVFQGRKWRENNSGTSEIRTGLGRIRFVECGEYLRLKRRIEKEILMGKLSLNERGQ